MSVFPALRAFTRPAPLRLGLAGLIGICVWAVAVGSAAAQPMPQVVLVQPEGEPPRPGLEPSLRIQLRDAAELSSQTAQWPADLPARIEAANRLAEAAGADWVVWAGAPRLVHEATSEAELESENAVLYLVGRRDGRALIEVVRVPAGQGPEVDRSLALKVHELIGAGDGAAYALGNAELPAPRPDGDAASDKDTRQSAQKVELWLEAGAQLGSAGNAGLTADLLIALGPSLVTDSFTLAVPIELSLGLPRSVERSVGEVEWSELSAAALVRLMLPVSSALVLGAGVGGKLAFIDATGTAPSGATGSSSDNLPGLLVSLDAELKLSSALGLRVSLGLEQRLRRQHLLIQGSEIANTGRTVPFGRISFVLHAF